MLMAIPWKPVVDPYVSVDWAHEAVTSRISEGRPGSLEGSDRLIRASFVRMRR